MTPIETDTIRVVTEERTREQKVDDGITRITKTRKVIYAQGDERDPGTWRHHSNYWERGAAISKSRGQRPRIIDVAVNPETGQIFEKSHLHRSGKRIDHVRGVWEQVDPLETPPKRKGRDNKQSLEEL